MIVLGESLEDSYYVSEEGLGSDPFVRMMISFQTKSGRVIHVYERSIAGGLPEEQEHMVSVRSREAFRDAKFIQGELWKSSGPQSK